MRDVYSMKFHKRCDVHGKKEIDNQGGTNLVGVDPAWRKKYPLVMTNISTDPKPIYRKTIRKWWFVMEFYGSYPLVNVYIRNWKIKISSGKTHTVNGHFQ